MKSVALLALLSLTFGTQYVTYVDKLDSWWPPTAIAAAIGVPGYASENKYTCVDLAFWLSWGPTDAAIVWSKAIVYFSSQNPWGNTTAAIQRALKAKYNNAGKKILVSAFGATEFPTSQGLDATETCTQLAVFVRDNNLDGVDLDYEDNAAMERGTGPDWLIDCTRAIRQILPKDQYILTHAPQAPYFMGESKYPKGGYLYVHEQVGDMIDWYNIQFYNQGSSRYDRYDSLFEQADGWSSKSSVNEIQQAGVPFEKLIVGKPASTGDAVNTGYVTAEDLSSFFRSARQRIGWTAGMMDWQYSSDKDGKFVETVAKGLETDDTEFLKA